MSLNQVTLNGADRIRWVRAIHFIHSREELALYPAALDLSDLCLYLSCAKIFVTEIVTYFYCQTYCSLEIFLNFHVIN